MEITLTTNALEQFCVANNRERWACIARALRGFKHPSGKRVWAHSRMADWVFTGEHPEFPYKTKEQVQAALDDFPSMPAAPYSEVMRILRRAGLAQ